MSTSVEIEPVAGRIWTVTPTLGSDGTVSQIKMVWGCAERTFKPGEENDAITTAGLAAAQALAAIRTTPPAYDDEIFELTERFT